MVEAIEAIESRRSIRRFSKRMPPREAIERICRAGSFAADGLGGQPCRAVAVTQPEKIGRLSRLNASFTSRPEHDPFYGAPVVIVVFAQSDDDTCVEDGSLVIGNMMLAAHALGLGSCWIHRAREEFETDEGRALCAAWGIDDTYRGIGHCIVGYPDGKAPRARPRRDDFLIWA